MSTTDTRAAFEAWCKDRHQDTTRDDRNELPFFDGYINLNTQCFWIGWQAATEAAKATMPKVEIELPAGDPRKVKIHLDTMKDGVRWLCCTVDAAKATGTAGELPEGWKIVPRKLTDEQAREIVYNINRKYKCNPMSDYLARAVWEWGIYASPNPPAEAARQPAPVAIKTWEERYADDRYARQDHKTKEFHMQHEIEDLRAALVATNRSQP